MIKLFFSFCHFIHLSEWKICNYRNWVMDIKCFIVDQNSGHAYCNYKKWFWLHSVGIIFGKKKTDCPYFGRQNLAWPITCSIIHYHISTRLERHTSHRRVRPWRPFRVVPHFCFRTTFRAIPHFSFRRWLAKEFRPTTGSSHPFQWIIIILWSFIPA